MRKVLIFPIFAILLTSCTNNFQKAAPTSDFAITLEPTLVVDDNTSDENEELPDYLPQFGDSELNRANAITSSIYLNYSDSDPAEVILHISGYLPTPCHELRIVTHPPDEENRVNLDIYALADPALDCEQVLRAFDIRVNLGTYPAGSYWVWVNDGRVGNFDY